MKAEAWKDNGALGEVTTPEEQRMRIKGAQEGERGEARETLKAV